MRGPRWFALLLLLPTALLGAVRGSITPSHRHDIWDTAAGFPGGYVYSITQTADGYLWIGTSRGLVRYDGLTFVTIRESDSSTETKFPVLGVLTDSNGQLWATDDRTHLFHYAAGHLVGPLPDNGIHQNRSGSVNRTHDGWLLFASEPQGLVEYEQGAAHVLLQPGLMPNRPTAAAQTEDGTFWIGTRDTGVFRLSLARGVPELQPVPGVTNIKVNCLLPFGASTLFIGTDKGLLTLHDGSLVQESRPELSDREILALANGLDGDVWIGTEGQVFKAQAKDIGADGRIRSLDDLAVRGTVTALFEDRDGDLWIGGAETIQRYRDSGFNTYLSSAGLPCSNCGAIYADPQEQVWFAPWDGGLFRLSQNSIEQIEVAGLKDDTVYSIAGGADDEVWIARRYGGVTRFRLRDGDLQASTYTRQNGLAQDAVYSIYRAPDGTVWAGTLDKGLSRFRGGVWHTFTTQDGLPSNRISAITGNASGEIFVGTPSGLAALKNDHWIAYKAHDGLPPGAIESLLLDDADTLWIGTTKGISFLQSGTVHVPLGAPNPLYGEILSIAENNGWLWITARDHVLRVRCSALLKQSFAEGDYREFGITEGLPSVEGVKRSRSVVQDNRGRIWFSLNEGISVLQPSAFARPALPVTIRLDGMLVDEKLIPPVGQIRVPAGRHRLTFRYAGVNVSNPGGVKYRYRLDNVDSAWSEPTALREIDYTNIPPGQFQFHVVARNPDGVWGAQETTMSFQVEPAYWQTRWFQVASVAALLLIALGLYRLRLQQLHRQFNVGLEARVNERTRIARELHDTLLQSFHGLMFQFQAARNMLPRRPEEAMQVLDGAIGATEQAITEGRGAIQDLRSEHLAQSDLAEVMTAMGQELIDVENTNPDSPIFRVIVEGQRQTLAPVLQNEVCRIAREILRNAFRHAHAHRIEAEIRFDAQALRLRIRDDGKGLDSKVLQEGGRIGHWGIRGVRERAQQIGAQLDFWSEAGAGTEVQLTVPAAVAYKSSRNGLRFKLFQMVKNYAKRS